MLLRWICLSNGRAIIHHSIKALDGGILSRTFAVLLLNEPNHSLIAFHVEFGFILSLDRVSLAHVFDVVSIIGDVSHAIIQSNE